MKYLQSGENKLKRKMYFSFFLRAIDLDRLIIVSLLTTIVNYQLPEFLPTISTHIILVLFFFKKFKSLAPLFNIFNRKKENQDVPSFCVLFISLF